MQAFTRSLPRAVVPTLVVHDAAHLRLAIDAARSAGLGRLRLLSAANAACFLGPAWWRSLIDIATALAADRSPELDDILDCGNAAGRALEALRLGQRVLVLEPTTQWPTVRARAEATGAVLLSERPVALDLADATAQRQLPAWLAQWRTGAADDSADPPG